MIDINDFDAIRIGLASSKQIRDWSSGEVTKPETINYRTLKPERDGLFCERIFGPTKDWECYCGKYKRVRYKGIICERCGVEVTRQKVRRERMGHIDLAAPVSHIWFFKGVPSRIGYLLDMAPKELEKVLYFAASIVTAVDVEKRAADLNDLEDKVRGESERIYVDRDEALAALEQRLQRRRNFFAKGADRDFDEDDDFWARGLANWAEEQGLPPLEEARTLVGGMFVELSGSITTEDSKKIRELVRNAAIREDRKLSPRELEQVAASAVQIRDALDPLRAELNQATGSKKGAITKHLNRVTEALLEGGDLSDEDRELVASVDAKQLEKARGLGNGLLRDVLDQMGDADPAAVRDLTNDLCLRTDGKIQKEDLDALVQWSLKVREMYLDMESRREDAREAAVEAVRRLEETWNKFRELEPKMVVNDEQIFRELKDRFGSPYGFGVYFRGGMGAESIRDLLKDLDLKVEAETLRETIRTSKGQKRERAIKRLKVVSAFVKSENRPEWMILEAVPVIPPELRPMVQLDGGRFATSDLNDLYRRVINRNNRLKRLLDLGAPEIIVNNEKRMLQEAVDALFDNGRRGRAVTGPGNRPLKSLSDMLKGKQGRFRQNLLGKRVDYSGRSVIVAGPYLKLHQCGLPKLMALELFKPFIMSRLVERKSVQNIKAAKKYVDSMTPEVWDVLEEVIAEHPVLLNRAPTLHRLGIQAFEPVLVEGKAIQVHPLVCHAFNADFDGDQMAVHLPLSAEAQAEARILMLSSNNILSPASGRPRDADAGHGPRRVLPHVLRARARGHDGRGRREGARAGRPEAVPDGGGGRVRGRGRPDRAAGRDPVPLGRRAPPDDAGARDLQRRGRAGAHRGHGERERRPAAARVHQPDALEARDGHVHLRSLGPLRRAHDRAGARHDQAPRLQVRDAGGRDDLEERHRRPGGQGRDPRPLRGPGGRRRAAVRARLDHRGGAPRAHRRDLDRGDRRRRELDAADVLRAEPDLHDGQLRSAQLVQADPADGRHARPDGESEGRDHRAPDQGQLHGGLSVLEYFISTHGARKGLADTALRTADSGYLTRRLVDVSQDVIIREHDCATGEWVDLPIHAPEGTNKSILGRILADDVHKPLATGKPGKTVVAEKGEEVTARRLAEIVEALGDAAEGATLPVRSVLKCRAEAGVCQTCYGTFLATGNLSDIGDAVGIIAAQSIGEPGTQLTMRTFHTGGVAGADITHGLPRVVEIFEARNPKGAAKLADVAGRVDVEETERGPKVTIFPEGVDENGEPLAEVEYQLARRTRLLVTKGQVVEAGDALHEGSLAPAELLALKGSTATELYLVGEVQKVYKSQGVDIHDKHIELIVRQMLKKVKVREAGDSDLLPGQLVDKVAFERENERVKREKGEPAQFEPLILGITKASLATESFLSAASFQETTKVLTDASIEGKVDHLLGLKENVIIGKLIPAATGLKRYRTIDIAPSEKVPVAMYTRPETEAELLAALEEIGADGGDIDLNALGIDFGGMPLRDDAAGGTGREFPEAEDVPEVDSPVDGD